MKFKTILFLLICSAPALANDICIDVTSEGSSYQNVTSEKQISYQAPRSTAMIRLKRNLDTASVSFTGESWFITAHASTSYKISHQGSMTLETKAGNVEIDFQSENPQLSAHGVNTLLVRAYFAERQTQIWLHANKVDCP